MNYKGSKKQTTHGDRCLDLYARIKHGSYAAKTNVPTEQVEFKKAEKECTHKPELTSYDPVEKDMSAIPGIEVVLDNMLRANAEK